MYWSLVGLVGLVGLWMFDTGCIISKGSPEKMDIVAVRIVGCTVCMNRSHFQPGRHHAAHRRESLAGFALPAARHEATAIMHLARKLVLLSWLVVASSCFEALHALTERGLTRREAEAVARRFQRRTGKRLLPSDVLAALANLDTLELLPGHITHLLRSHPLHSFDSVDPSWHRWCSYKTHIWCSCNGVGRGSPLLRDDGTADVTRPPHILSFDCEFKPLRCAMVSTASSGCGSAAFPNPDPDSDHEREPRSTPTASCGWIASSRNVLRAPLCHHSQASSDATRHR